MIHFNVELGAEKKIAVLLDFNDEQNISFIIGRNNKGPLLLANNNPPPEHLKGTDEWEAENNIFPLGMALNENALDYLDTVIERVRRSMPTTNKKVSGLTAERLGALAVRAAGGTMGRWEQSFAVHAAVDGKPLKFWQLKCIDRKKKVVEIFPNGRITLNKVPVIKQDLWKGIDIEKTDEPDDFYHRVSINGDWYSLPGSLFWLLPSMLTTAGMGSVPAELISKYYYSFVKASGSLFTEIKYDAKTHAISISPVEADQIKEFKIVTQN